MSGTATPPSSTPTGGTWFRQRLNTEGSGVSSGGAKTPFRVKSSVASGTAISGKKSANSMRNTNTMTKRVSWGAPLVTENDVKERFLVAFNRLMENRDRLIWDCRLVLPTLCGTTAIDAEFVGFAK